jgi:probable DNA repair protein
MPISRIQMTRSDLLDALADGAVAATGNARLARSLAAEFDRRMLAQGRTTWSTPAVLPWPAWLREAFDEASLHVPGALPRVLSAEQEEQLWAAVIRQDAAAAQQPLLRVDATARRAREAWQRLGDWRLDLADRRFGQNENAEAFRRWARRFRALLRERGQAAAAELPGLLLPLLKGGACTLPARLLLAGFQELTPAQACVLEALRAAGCAAEWVTLTGRPGQVRRLPAPDDRQEMRLAVDWARQLLRQQPDARIGIVVPDLGARRAALANLLAARLQPGSLRPGAPPVNRPWNISLGRPLSACPIVRTALDLLALLRPPADTTALGALLASPYWALPAEAAERQAELGRRALLDRRLRRTGEAALGLSTVRFFAAQTGDDGAPQPWSAPLLAAHLGRLLEASRGLPGRANAGNWATAFTAWLRAGGWAGAGGGRPLDSAEFQAVDAWQRLLSTFAGLADFAGQLSRDGALALLGRLAADTLFQPRAAEAPVQVLGLYESIGLAFDHLWVMGLHDAAWPPAPSPDPYLPLGLQREAGLPHCDPERERAWAAQVTAGLCAAAPHVVLSHPLREGSEELGCSPLLAPFEALTAEALLPDPEPSWQDLIRESAQPEAAPAEPPLPLATAQAGGGSSLFRNQAACPFRAFAEHRLGARPLDRVQAGLGPMRRGTLLHDVLETLWRELETQAALLALGGDALRERVRAHVAAALDREQGRSRQTLSGRYAVLEARRLEEKVLAWLELERQRSPFRVVGLEHERQFESGGVRVRVVLDRVDELEDGARVVLDYKTGQVQSKGWFGARPEDPQLPLYAVAASTDGAGGADDVAAPLAALAFAQIRPDRVEFSGVVRAAGILPGLPVNRKGPLREATETWPAVLGEWARVLERLGQAFRAGRAEVDPLRGLRTCESTYCELAALCRVRERLAGIGDGEVDEDDAGGDAAEPGHG